MQGHQASSAGLAMHGHSITGEEEGTPGAEANSGHRKAMSISAQAAAAVVFRDAPTLKIVVTAEELFCRHVPPYNLTHAELALLLLTTIVFIATTWELFQD